ncbi:MAG: heme exporter protein CcmD [Ectothiorhodospiraceae bacterium]|nr:heme exporter protein CcmD [Ectothiorhodospiraceae bacterium]
MSEFFAMGGYGFYVWSSYAITAVVLVLNIVKPWLASRQTRRRLASRLQARGDTP